MSTLQACTQKSLYQSGLLISGRGLPSAPVQHCSALIWGCIEALL